MTDTAKNRNCKVFLVLLTPADGDTSVPPGVCPNCLGAGHLGLDVTMSGPFKNAPSGNDTLRPAYFQKNWWLVARSLYPCPQCNPVQTIVL